MLNNIMRNYGHEWVYSPDELRRALATAGLPAAAPAACESDRRGRGLPAWATRAMRRALGPKDPELRCWLDQEVRADESMYFNVVKPEEGRASPRRRSR